MYWKTGAWMASPLTKICFFYIQNKYSVLPWVAIEIDRIQKSSKCDKNISHNCLPFYFLYLAHFDVICDLYWKDASPANSWENAKNLLCFFFVMEHLILLANLLRGRRTKNCQSNHSSQRVKQLNEPYFMMK